MSDTGLLGRLVASVQRLYGEETAESERWNRISAALQGAGKFAHRRLNPDTGETYDHPGPHQIPYEL